MMEMVRCRTCDYICLRTDKEGEPCSKCNGLVKVIYTEDKNKAILANSR